MVLIGCVMATLFGLFHVTESAVTFTSPPTESHVIIPSRPEGTDAAGTDIYVVEAESDGTKTGSITITYGLVRGSAWFSVDTTGYIKTTFLLDYETAATHTILVKGLDDADDPASATVTLKLSISDLATDPLFGSLGYFVVIPDEYGPGEAVKTLQATDANGDELTYSIMAASNTNNDFTIDPDTGAITTANILYGTSTKTYELVVYAADSSQTATTTLSVCVGSSTQCAGRQSSNATAQSVNQVLAFFGVLLKLFIRNNNTFF